MRRQTKASGAMTLSMLLSANTVLGKMSLIQAMLCAWKLACCICKKVTVHTVCAPLLAFLNIPGDGAIIVHALHDQIHIYISVASTYLVWALLERISRNGSCHIHPWQCFCYTVFQDTSKPFGRILRWRFSHEGEEQTAWVVGADKLAVLGTWRKNGSDVSSLKAGICQQLSYTATRN